MMLWLLGFWMAAYVVVPSFLGFLGITAASGSNGRVAALKHLILDIIQLIFSIGLLKTTLREYDITNLGLFKFQLSPVSSWIPSLAAGLASFPLIDWVHRRMVHLIHGNMDTDGSVLRGAVEQIASGSDWGSWAAWFGVLALCAPVWEEVMFRGFLLPSLGRYLPPWAAIVCTSFIFAGVHFSKEGFLPLVLLGVVFGAVYIKTRNLLPAVMLHSLWNIALLGQIMIASG
jgi:membrane protease YdiL (CAAX protease family)